MTSPRARQSIAHSWETLRPVGATPPRQVLRPHVPCLLLTPEAVGAGRLPLAEVADKLGVPVAAVVRDVLSVRALPDGVDLYDDETSR